MRSSRTTKSWSPHARKFATWNRNYERQLAGSRSYSCANRGVTRHLDATETHERRPGLKVHPRQRAEPAAPQPPEEPATPSTPARPGRRTLDEPCRQADLAGASDGAGRKTKTTGGSANSRIR